jgi:hypothetical protein
MEQSTQVPVTCKKYQEEFTTEEKEDENFKCKTCKNHPDWHEHRPYDPQGTFNFSIIHFSTHSVLFISP